MAKGQPEATRGSATKRRSCLVCGKFGHGFEGCWLLDKSKNMEKAVVHTLPILEEMGMDDKTSNNEGNEGAV
jgi:hypothetical protein